MAVNKQAVVAMITSMIQDHPLMLITGMIVLAAGLAMVLGHTIWSGGALPVVVTLIGWILVLRGTLLLFLPPTAVANLAGMLRIDQLFYPYAAAGLVLGLYLSVASFAAGNRRPR